MTDQIQSQVVELLVEEDVSLDTEQAINYSDYSDGGQWGDGGDSWSDSTHDP